MNRRDNVSMTIISDEAMTYKYSLEVISCQEISSCAPLFSQVLYHNHFHRTIGIDIYNFLNARQTTATMITLFEERLSVINQNYVDSLQSVLRSSNIFKQSHIELLQSVLGSIMEDRPRFTTGHGIGDLA